MPDNVQDATFEILKRLRQDIVELRAEMNQRFDTLAAEAHTDRRKLNGLMLLLTAASGDFDERIRELDDRVSTLEDRAG